MKALLCTLLILATGSLLIARQFNTTASADENRILTLESAWDKAEEQKDTKVLEELLSSSLAYTDSDGTFMNKAEFLASVSSPSIHPELITSESVTAHSFGPVVITTGVYHEKGMANGKGYSHRGRFTDTWVNENGVWHCVASQLTLLLKQ